MKSAHILLLCVLAAALLSTSDCNSAVGPDSCCFEFFPRTITKNRISSYIVTDRRCTKSGVILVTKRSNKVCVDPSLSWVKKIMESLDKKNL